MAAQLTVTSDEGDDGAFSVRNAKASHGACKVDGNVLTYTPEGDFLGTDVVTCTLTDGKATNKDRKLIVHVIAVPAGQPAKSGVQQIALPAVAHSMAASAITAALPSAPSRQEVTMYQNMAARLTLTSEDGKGEAFHVTDAKASHGKCVMDGNVLTFTPESGFLGTDVVHYTARDGAKAVEEKALIVHVIEAPLVLLVLPSPAPSASSSPSPSL